MRRLPALICLMLAALRAFAEGPDDQYLHIYDLIQQGDSLAFSGQSSDNRDKSGESRTGLMKFQKSHPDWNGQIVKFRLGYLEGKISAIAPRLPAAAAPESAASGSPTTASPALSAEQQSQLNSLNEQVRQLQAERSVLQAKLKEAFAAQPAAVDPHELARADDRIKALQKDNDSLRVALAELKSKPAPAPGSKATEQARALDQAQQAVAQANRKLAEQTEKTKSLEQEKAAMQRKLQSFVPSTANADWIRASKIALDDANRQLAGQKDLAAKLSLEKAALDSRLQTLSREADPAHLLRLENHRLNQQLPDPQKP